MADKEKRKQELEKLKSLNFGEKIEYLWMYYKMWLVAAVCVAAGIYLAFSMYRGSQENVVLNVAIVGGSNQDTDELVKDFKAYAGIDGKNDVVRVQANIPADGGSMTSKTALTTLIGANAVDVMICPEDIYQEYKAQDGFVSLGDLPSYESDMTIRNQKDIVVLENNEFLKNTVGVPYEKAYIGVLINAQHKENAKTFIKYLLTQ